MLRARTFWMRAFEARPGRMGDAQNSHPHPEKQRHQHIPLQRLEELR